MYKLAEETIIYILDNFLNRKDKFNFATVDKRTRDIATRFSLIKNHVLKDTVNGLEIYRTIHLIIEDRYYDPKFL